MAVAMAGDQAVSGARLEFHLGTQFASLSGGGTVKEWCGRGIYRAPVSQPTAAAAIAGSDISDQSRPTLERLGSAAPSATTPCLIQG